MEKEKEKQWFTSGEAAEVVEVSQSWIIRQMEDGKIPFTWFGGRRKIKAEDVEELRQNGSK